MCHPVLPFYAGRHVKRGAGEGTRAPTLIMYTYAHVRLVVVTVSSFCGMCQARDKCETALQQVVAVARSSLMYLTEELQNIMLDALEPHLLTRIIVGDERRTSEDVRRQFWPSSPSYHRQHVAGLGACSSISRRVGTSHGPHRSSVKGDSSSSASEPRG